MIIPIGPHSARTGAAGCISDIGMRSDNLARYDRSQSLEFSTIDDSVVGLFFRDRCKALPDRREMGEVSAVLSHWRLRPIPVINRGGAAAKKTTPPGLRGRRIGVNAPE